MSWSRIPSTRITVHYQLHFKRPISTTNLTEAREAAEKLLAQRFKPVPSEFDDYHRRNFVRPFVTALPKPLQFGDLNSPKESLWRHHEWDNNYYPLSHFFPCFHRTQGHRAVAADGADGFRWPGMPWDLRVWAGGRMQLLRSPFFQTLDLRRRYVMVEKVKSVRTTGEPPNDKIYATFRKIIVDHERFTEIRPVAEALLQAKDESEMDPSAVMVEDQTLCYMRSPSDPSQSLLAKSRPMVPPPVQSPDFSWIITPTSSHLFFFSAFTLNAHAIHLDPTYARSHYGLRDVIVQGQLTVFLMLEVLRAALANQALRYDTPLQEPVDIDYRNLSPLYVNEPFRICCARLPTTSDEHVPATDTKPTSSTPPPPSQAPNSGFRRLNRPATRDPPRSAPPQEWSVWIQTEPPSTTDPSKLNLNPTTSPHISVGFNHTVAVRARVKTRQLDPRGGLSARYKRKVAEEGDRPRKAAVWGREARSDGS